MSAQRETHEVLIVPGWQDSGPGHWQTLWHERMGWPRLAQSNWLNPDRESWLASLSETLARFERPPILVAHSLGCHLVAEWARINWELIGVPGVPSVRGALMVAPPDLDRPDMPAEVLGFKPMFLERLPFKSTLIASSTDPYATLERSQVIARAWGSELVNLGPRGHINLSAGFGQWPEGEAHLIQLMAQTLES